MLLTGSMRRGLTALLFSVLASTSSSAAASWPEQLYEGPPDAGHVRLETNSQLALSAGAAPSHSAELFAGVSERLAIGGEIEGEVEDGRLQIEEVGAAALVRLTDEEAPVEIALLMQASFGIEGGPPELEGRLMLEREVSKWSLLGNIIVRRAQEDGEGQAALGYAALVERHVTGPLSVGLEGSGTIARSSGHSEDLAEAHYLGPSIALEVPFTSAQRLNLGIKYLLRVGGQAGRVHTGRITADLSF